MSLLFHLHEFFSHKTKKVCCFCNCVVTVSQAMWRLLLSVVACKGSHSLLHNVTLRDEKRWEGFCKQLHETKMECIYRNLVKYKKWKYFLSSLTCYFWVNHLEHISRQCLLSCPLFVISCGNCDLCFLGYLIFQAIQKGNLEGAKIHAENAIRQKNQVSENDKWINENIHGIIVNNIYLMSVAWFS